MEAKRRSIGIRLCATCTQKKEKKPTDEKKFKSWAYGFSATVLKVIFVLWAFSIIFGAVMIAYAMITTGQIAEPVNFMHEVNSTFGASVIGVLVTRVVGNVFEHNDGGIFGKSIKEGNENDSASGYVLADDHSSDDVSDCGGSKEDAYG
ncbi:MAG: hypothetical protein IJJ13_00470 [Lachnospiraceae bacterium]|nr:hypothetical protein [Lachnospiraceae bacterium]